MKVFSTLGFLRCEPESPDKLEEEGERGGRQLEGKGKEREGGMGERERRKKGESERARKR